jgi:dsRNA-specific ribonuclease
MFCSLACLSDPGLEILEAGPRSVALILATSTPTEPRNPVSLLNELAQVGHIRAVTWSVEVSARGADKKHTVHVNAHSADGKHLAGRGTAPGKADARGAAANDLLIALVNS